MNYKRYIITPLVLICFIFNCKNINENQTNIDEISVSIPESEILENNGSLICIKNRITYGKAKEGQVIKHNFLFSNNGGDPVKIVEYNASCNCTVLDVKGKVVPPQKSIEIEMKIDTKNKSKGTHSSTVTLESTGQRKFHLLLIKYEIE